MCVCVCWRKNLSYYFEREILHNFIPQNAFPSFFCSHLLFSRLKPDSFSSVQLMLLLWWLGFYVQNGNWDMVIIIFCVYRELLLWNFHISCLSNIMEYVYMERMNDGNILLSRSVFTQYADADVFMRRRKCLGGGWLVNCDRSFLFALQAVSSSSRRAVASDCLDEWCSSRHLNAEWAFFSL